MFKKISYIFIFIFLLPKSLFSQTGKLRGHVTHKEMNEPLYGAVVKIDGTSLSCITDEFGEYVILGIPIGEYTVHVLYLNGKWSSVSGIRIHAHLTTTHDFILPSEFFDGEVRKVNFERPLIQRNATSTVHVFTQKDIEHLPIRGLHNIIALKPGTVIQDGEFHVRGGRTGETAYFVDGHTALNTFTNFQNMRVIQEAVEEIQFRPGGYAAEFGGANSALVHSTLRTGGKRLSMSVDYRTDDFAHSGEQFLGTSPFGYRNAVVTVGGSVPSLPRIRFFVAAQHHYMRNKTPSFVEPFRFEGLTDDGFTGRTPGEPLPGPVEYKRNHLPNNWKHDNTVQGTLVFDLSDDIRWRFTGSYRHYKATAQGTDFFSSLYNYFNLDRLPLAINKTMLLGLRHTHRLSPTTYYELSVSYSDRSYRINDPEFGDDWKSYTDCLKNAELGYAGWRSRYLGPRDYSTICNFEFEAYGEPINWYYKNDQSNLSISFDLTTQRTKQWELKVGGRFNRWTMCFYSINSIKQFMETENGIHGNQPRSFDNEYERMVKLAKMGGVTYYGYDVDGNRLDDSPNGPRHPTFISLYVQNKFEFYDLIANVGFRYEYMDIKALKPFDIINPAMDTRYDFIIEEELVESEPHYFVLPRANLAFPLNERTVLFASYGKYVQMPALNSIYRGIPKLSETVSPVTRSAYGYFGQYVGFKAKPEVSIQYEVGIRQVLKKNLALTITAFYKNMPNLLRLDRLYYYSAEYDRIFPLYSGCLNRDFATIKGIEFVLEMQRTKRLSLRANYTLSSALGTGSHVWSSSVCVSDEVTARYPTIPYPMDYHQPHRGSFLIDYRFPHGDENKPLEGFGINLLLTFNSGHAYTKIQERRYLGTANPWDVGIRALIDTRGRRPEESLNSSLTPWFFNVDLNINKTFYFKTWNLDVYAQILNLFNTQHIINLYPTTAAPNDDGWLTSAFITRFLEIPNYVEFYRTINNVNRWNYQLATGNDIYGMPRQIRVGVRLEM